MEGCIYIKLNYIFINFEILFILKYCFIISKPYLRQKLDSIDSFLVIILFKEDK